MATPSAEDRQTQDGTPYKWSDYVHNVSSIIFARHGDADRIICVNDPYGAPYSTKDDERDMRVQGKAHVPNTYMKLADLSPVPERSKRSCVASAINDMQLPDRPSAGCRRRYYLLGWLQLHQPVNSATDAELQL